MFLENINRLEKKGTNLQLVGKKEMEGRVAVGSVQTPGRDVSEIAYLLDKNNGIMTRVGLHCAPVAHKSLGTYPQGTVRIAFSASNTKEEIDVLLEALESYR